LILDEPTAALSEEMTASFLKLLPIMQTAVSHIVVITPQPLSVDYPNAKTFTVVKKGGQSTIREGVIRA
jgi:predicted ATPase